MSGDATPPPKPDETPIDPSTTAAKLEKSLQQRPEEQELKERNILKSACDLINVSDCTGFAISTRLWICSGTDSNVAPGLQGIEEGLKRAQLEVR